MLFSRFTGCGRLAPLIHAKPKAGLRRLLKFLHTMGATGLIGAMACLIVLIIFVPPPDSLAEYALMFAAMDRIASWILFPSLAITLISGLLAIAWNRAFHNAGWAWVKLLTGVLLFEGGLVNVQGPIKEEAQRSVDALASHVNAATEAFAFGSERNSLWVLLAVATANVVLGVWRPRISRGYNSLTSSSPPPPRSPP